MINRLLFLLLLLFPVVVLSAADELRDEACLDCHGVTGFAVPTGETGDSPMRALDINADALRQSVHGKLSCVMCHADIEKLPHGKEGLQAVDCVTCHARLAEEGSGSQRRGRRAGGDLSSREKTVLNTERYRRSIHGDPTIENNAACKVCHTAHYVYRSDDPRSTTYPGNSPQVCGSCHVEALEAYRLSVHGANLSRPWRGESATCSDCHTSHRVTGEKLTAHRLVTDSCGDCHWSEVESYLATTHGALAWLGSEKAARCASCHRPHATHAIDDPLSLVSEENKLDTCRECHEKANGNFIQYRVHGNTHDYEKYPYMWLTAKIMVGIVLFVLIFFYLHSMLWFYREIQSRVIEWRVVDSRRYPFRVKRPHKKSDRHFRRFSWQWRLNHWAVALSVMTLVFTGMSVMYANSPWAVWVVEKAGGHDVFTTIHRFAAVVFLSAVVAHVAAVIYNIRRNPDFDWFGPDSLLPRKKDWEDMVGQFRWFFGKGEQPRFDRWTYWEKFDYWAVYWGALVIGISGMMLWFSDTIGNLLPGWVLNVATIAHGVEAFLAVMTLFVVHFFNNHIRPGKFPLDIVMFSGSWDLEEFKEERPEEYRRLVESGELEKYLVPPPSPARSRLFHILGFTLLGIGFILLILVVRGFLHGGLV